MDFRDASYWGLSTLVGGVARALRRGLPEAWRLRLEAQPPEDLPPGRWIWVHAVSVGELLVAEGLVAKLRDLGHRLHLTTGTPAGLELLNRRLPALDAGSGRLSGGAFPFDDPAGLRSWLGARPGLHLALETELWPGLLRALEAQGVPSALVNARLTARSLRNPLASPTVKRYQVIAARDGESAEAFRALGAHQVALAGNLKADLPPPPPLHEGWGHLRSAWAPHPVLVVGNTVDGEEALALALWRTLRERRPGLRLILAPRQPRRFDEVAGLLQGISARRASEAWPETPEGWAQVEVLLLDTLGELSRAYGEGTLALVGGGWCWEGGHNPLEPLRFGVPTLVGPGFRNFEDLVTPLRAAGGLQVVEAAGLAAAAGALLEDSALRASGEPAPALAGLLGATDRVLDLLAPVLPAPVRRM